MKKVIKLFKVASIITLLFLQTITSQMEYKLDSIQSYTWDESLMALQMVLRQHYTYADEGASATNLLSMLKTNGNWVNNQQTNTSHNNLGLPLISTNQLWNLNTNEWLNNLRFSYTHNTFNAIENLVTQSWDNYSNTWQNFVKDEFIYNNSQLEIKNTNYTFDNNQDIWIPNFEFETFYDENDRTTKYVQRNYDPILMQLVNDLQTVNTIIDDVLTERLQQEWDTSLNQWVNSSNSEFVYDNNLIIQTNDFIWANDTWQPARQTNQTYNGSGQIETTTTLIYYDPNFLNYSRITFTHTNNQITQSIFESWDTATSVWENTQKLNYAYDANDNLIENYRYTWDTLNNVWKENTKVLYFYSEVLPFVLSTLSSSLLETKVYPNPASDYITIKSLYPVKTIEMYNTLGKLLYTTNKNTIEVESFQKGVYLLKIETDKGQITKRVIVH